MSSATETAILALVAAVAAKAAEDSYATLPPPTRNEDMVSRLTADQSGTLERYLNIVDGDRADPEELLGADLGIEAYDIVWNPLIEFAVLGGTPAEREAAFDAMRVALWDAIKPDTSGGSITYLGGAVSSVIVIDMLPNEKSAPVDAGIPNVKASDFLLALTYTSERPF